jgi:hypothetical protein
MFAQGSRCLLQARPCTAGNVGRAVADLDVLLSEPPFAWVELQAVESDHARSSFI